MITTRKEFVVRTFSARIVLSVVVTALGLACASGCGSDSAMSSNGPTVTGDATPPTNRTVSPTDGLSSADRTVNGINSIAAPVPGSTVAGPTTTVTGKGTALEGTLNYRVLLAGTDDIVVAGWARAGSNGEIAPYTFDLALDPGTYTVQVWRPDESNGKSSEGLYRNLVETTFTVQ